MKNANKITGILLLDKPLDLTSNAALQRAKRLFNAKKAGHTGSLDPKATGMLPICFGEATKFSQFLLNSDKYYEVEVRLGIKTTTGDVEGEVIAECEVPAFSANHIETVLSQFKGEQLQIPPMHSAIKMNGQPLYRLARKGVAVVREPRSIHIYDIKLTGLTAQTFTMQVHCSKGTYIRTLAEDIGEKLQVGAHVSQLCRTYVSPYAEDKIYTFEELEEIQAKSGLPGLIACLLPLDTSVKGLPAIQLSRSASFYLKMGQPVLVPHLPTEGHVRMYSNTDFLGIGHILEDGRVAPQRLMGS